MNMHHPTAADQAKKARELREKFFGKASGKNVASTSNVSALADARQTIREQAARISEMAATIAALQSMVIGSLRKDGLTKTHQTDVEATPVQVINQVLAERHPEFSFAHVVGKSQSLDCVAARRDCVRTVKDCFPSMSQTEIARLFRKDRSTISNLLKKRGRA